MCEWCVEIEKHAEQYRELLRLIADQAEIEPIKQLIAQLYANRGRLHQSPKK